MTFFSDSQETISRFGEYIDELQDFFRSSGVAFGVPDNFFTFARRLQKDTQLRADLSVLAKTFMERESQVSLRTVLTILAVASGGPDVATSDREISLPVNLIIDFLISVGGCSRISAEHPDSPCSESIVDPDEHSLALDRSSPDHPPLATHHDTFISDTTPDQGSQELILQPAFASSLDPIAADSHANVNILTESLTRLELSSLEVKFYLDSIDQRISRMEPRLENIPSLVLPAAPQPHSQNVTPHVRDANDAKFSAAVPPLTRHDDSDSNRDPLQATRQNEVRKNVEANQANEPKHDPEPKKFWQTKKFPLAFAQPWTRSKHLFSSGRQYAFPILLLCGVLLLAGLVYRRLGRDTAQANAVPVSETLPPSADSLPHETQKPSAVFTTDPSNTTSRSVAKSDQSVNPRSPIATRQSSTTASSSFDPSPSSAPAYSESSAEVATDTTAGTDARSPEPAPRAATRWTPSVLSNRRVNVSSGVMAANLLSAPKPTYPKLASLTHTQGNVVMQAIISKKGTVENLRVLKGHRLLRSAATSAVRTWRFRPYLVDGVPVEVATIVSVDFARH
ncbi:energy transducer TonB [Tunturiibacter gelidoferens]|uniref:TonB family protein n=1 Tax=Tunturiibacter lichenicola TaxID=2051959 RepID=A0A7Y9NND6_9BACT|nr:energy transducer TonB [Edaphobacter lichenicola]NYF52584.1 TonB family protein [Edaphobacter lichenicola]